MIILDTNVVSELMRPEPDQQVVSWARQQRPSRVAITAVTVAEIGAGIARLPLGGRRTSLADRAARIFANHAREVLPFDLRAAAHFCDILAVRAASGRPMSGFDAQIAAIARAHDAAIATRDVGGFDGLGVHLVNPWTA